MPVGRGLGTFMSTRNMAELPVVLDVLSDGLENCFFFRRRRQFLLLAARKDHSIPLSKRKTQVPTTKRKLVFTCRVAVVF